MTPDQEKISKAQSLFLDKDPLSSWGRYLLTRLVDAEARAMKAEHEKQVTSVGGKYYRAEHLGPWTRNPYWHWTQAQWQQAAKERLGVEG